MQSSKLYNYIRRKRSVVSVGGIPMGGDYPIRIQSMTNTPTLDTKATVAQCKRIIDAGADYVRITTPAIRDAENLAGIKKQLRESGYTNPLIADVHFNPAVAEAAARLVEKVRINPGNYIDKKKFEQVDFTDQEYKYEIERIHERVLPLLRICKEYGTALRIGVNHGSLSDRIMSRYGDTPEGMVESAMEFLRIFSSEGFHQTVISMKSSNTRVMVHSTRLLVARMQQEGMFYPVHLGVTEAGEGEDGIIKSAVGTGTLLAEGIGETIRVSLTGDPEQEIPVAREIVKYFTDRYSHEPIPNAHSLHFEPFTFVRHKTEPVENIGGNHPPRIIIRSDSSLKLQSGDILLSDEEEMNRSTRYVKIDTESAQSSRNTDLEDKFLILTATHLHYSGTIRSILAAVQKSGLKNPVILHKRYHETSPEKLQIKAACDFGPLLIDGFADGIWIENDNPSVRPNEIYQLGLSILQASRLRMSKTEYISCPSCGRTLFDLTATLKKIKEKTQHLSHLKIGVMGCIVNGPGEMADADYGYVGAGPNRITLYKNKNVVKKNIPELLAVEELISIIKENGDWKEPDH